MNAINTLLIRLTLLILMSSISFLSGNEVNQTEVKSETKDSLTLIYESHVQAPSDIHEHLPVLRQLAKECASVTEIGMKPLISTWAILKGLSENGQSIKRYLGIEREMFYGGKVELAEKMSKENGIDFVFWPVNDLRIMIEPTDLLMIDSIHTYCHLRYQLEKFSKNVRKYIVMHDTSPPWGEKNDESIPIDSREYPVSYDRRKQGLWPAIEDFLRSHPEWSVEKRLTNNYGLTILKRKEPLTISLERNPKIEEILQRHIVLCTGPALRSRKLLIQSTERDLQLIPFKKIFVATNDQQNVNVKFADKIPVMMNFEAKEKQLDCLNSLIQSIKMAVNDPEVLDDDIILFKHEIVYINDMHLLRKAIGKFIEGYDMVSRTMVYHVGHPKGTDVFFVKVSAIKELIKDFPLVTSFRPDAPFCERLFAVDIANRIRNIYSIPYLHSNGGFTELGFYHIFTGGNEIHPDWEAPIWDLKNYDTLFD
ncbi:MAG: hypothetical protein ACH350_06320 [Parachlamydiaceae bacterium]